MFLTKEIQLKQLLSVNLGTSGTLLPVESVASQLIIGLRLLCQLSPAVSLTHR